MLVQRHATLALFVFSVLANALTLGPRSNSSEAKPHRWLAKRSEMKRIVVVGGSIGAESHAHCTPHQVRRIDEDIAWMRKLAASAYNFLLKEDSHTTAAYIAWFGANNTDRKTADAIRREVYDAIWDLGDDTDAYVGELEGYSGAVVLGCPDTTTEPLCENAVAVANRPGNFARLCPLYFQQSFDYEEQFRSWRMSRTRSLTGAETLLHEMTHLPGVVGSWNTDDIAYEKDKCLLLRDAEMINNADNYMLFALEVRANPDNAAKQIDMKAEEAKYKIARRLLAEGSSPPVEAPAGGPFGYPGMWIANQYVAGHFPPYGYSDWPPPWC
ncbi:Neutral protease 2-like protein [Colletotrichum spinosum]|uniref:Neutral protease 2-like protein n=1 Tax=Colletotrichum spinosum TaxID=1347390 RepID=A0A4R8Q947_9PEZI|nr:Neutral protease 2-like protein [Colletotrichum spinosum]